MASGKVIPWKSELEDHFTVERAIVVGRMTDVVRFRDKSISQKSYVAVECTLLMKHHVDAGKIAKHALWLDSLGGRSTESGQEILVSLFFPVDIAGDLEALWEYFRTEYMERLLPGEFCGEVDEVKFEVSTSWNYGGESWYNDYCVQLASLFSRVSGLEVWAIE